MLAFLLRRCLAAAPVLALVAVIVFGLVHLAPGDPAAVLAGEQAGPEEIARLRAALGLERPVWERFGLWLGDVLRGDLGVSVFSGRPVVELIARRAEPTIALTLAALVVAVLIAVPLGVVAAWRAGKLADQAAMAFAVLGFSMPVFVLGYLLTLAFAVAWPIFPVQGYAPLSAGPGPFLARLALPALALGIVNAALIARITRAAMLEALSQDYVRTARAKGLSTSAVLLGHALKNAAPPIVTVVGLSFAGLVTGVVVTETVFNIPGLGRLIVDAILRRDYPVIQGVTLVFAVVYVLVNLVVDVAYGALDPRIRT